MSQAFDVHSSETRYKIYRNDLGKMTDDCSSFSISHTRAHIFHGHGIVSGWIHTHGQVLNPYVHGIHTETPQHCSSLAFLAA